MHIHRERETCTSTERERERERERHAHPQRERETDRERERHPQRKRERERRVLMADPLKEIHTDCSSSLTFAEANVRKTRRDAHLCLTNDLLKSSDDEDTMRTIRLFLNSL